MLVDRLGDDPGPDRRPPPGPPRRLGTHPRRPGRPALPRSGGGAGADPAAAHRRRHPPGRGGPAARPRRPSPPSTRPRSPSPSAWASTSCPAEAAPPADPRPVGRAVASARRERVGARLRPWRLEHPPPRRHRPRDPQAGRRADGQQRVRPALPPHRRRRADRRGQRARASCSTWPRRSTSAGCSRPTATGTTSRPSPRCATPGTRSGVTAEDAAMLDSYDEIIGGRHGDRGRRPAAPDDPHPGPHPGSMCFLRRGQADPVLGRHALPRRAGQHEVRGRRLRHDHPLDRGPAVLEARRPTPSCCPATATTRPSAPSDPTSRSGSTGAGDQTQRIALRFGRGATESRLADGCVVQVRRRSRCRVDRGERSARPTPSDTRQRPARHDPGRGR